MKNRHLKRSGMVLYVVLMSTVVLALLITGVMSYSTSVARSVSIVTRESEARLAAQSVLERAKDGMFESLKRYRQAFPLAILRMTWFDTASPTQIGPAGYSYTMPRDVEVNGFNISVELVDGNVEFSRNTARVFASVRLRATASGTTTSGVAVNKQIEEKVEFSLLKSDVFNYAYFVNNFGWFYGSGISLNGDAKSNFSFEVDPASLINGDVLAHLRAWLQSGATATKHQTVEEYWKKATSRMRPTNPPAPGGEEHLQGYDGESALYSNQEQTPMPFLGDLQFYRELAALHGGTISQDGEVLVNGTFSGIGPSGVTNAVDTGCIVLTGTRNNPIVIDGPVVVDRDVVISGYVSGRGTIYAGRNIHIIGDVNYVNAPSWPKPDANPAATVERNAGKDMLGLCAKGNIVLGDYTNPTWLRYVKPYITPPFTRASESDPSDASIGYPATFNGNYTAFDGLQKVDKVGKDKGEVAVSTRNSRYYESLVDDKLIKCKDSYTIINIDGVLYNNHSVMGRVGNCDINGSLVTRDEAIIYRASVSFNWDIRLGSESPDGMNFFMFLPVDIAESEVVGWIEL